MKRNTGAPQLSQDISSGDDENAGNNVILRKGRTLKPTAKMVDCTG